MHQGFTYGLQELLGAGYQLEAEQRLLFDMDDGVAMLSAPLPMLFDPYSTFFELSGVDGLTTADGIELATLSWPVLFYFSDAQAEFMAEYEMGMIDGDWPQLVGTVAWSDTMEYSGDECDHYEPWELWPVGGDGVVDLTESFWQARNDLDDVWTDAMTEYIMLTQYAQDDDTNYQKLLALADRGELMPDQHKSLEDMELMLRQAAELRDRLWDPATKRLRVTSGDLDFEVYSDDLALRDAWFLTKRSLQINHPVYRDLNLRPRRIA